MSNSIPSAAPCLECDVNLDVPENCVVGEIVPCEECGCEMEVASLDPFTFELAPEIEEDWGE